MPTTSQRVATLQEKADRVRNSVAFSREDAGCLLALEGRPPAHRWAAARGALTYSGSYAWLIRSMDLAPVKARPRIQVMPRQKPPPPRTRRPTLRRPFVMVWAEAFVAPPPRRPPARGPLAHLVHSPCSHLLLEYMRIAWQAKLRVTCDWPVRIRRLVPEHLSRQSVCSRVRSGHQSGARFRPTGRQRLTADQVSGRGHVIGRESPR